MLMLYIHCVMKSNILFHCFIIKYFKQSLLELFKLTIALINLHFAALNPSHVKYIVQD